MKLEVTACVALFVFVILGLPEAREAFRTQGGTCPFGAAGKKGGLGKAG